MKRVGRTYVPKNSTNNPRFSTCFRTSPFGTAEKNLALTYIGGKLRREIRETVGEIEDKLFSEECRSQNCKGNFYQKNRYKKRENNSKKIDCKNCRVKNKHS